MRALRRYSASAVAVLAVAALAVGCGSSDSSSSGGAAENHPAPPAADFPNPKGKSMEELLDPLTSAKLVAAPAAMTFQTGRNRYPFGVFHKDHSPVDDAEVALYLSKVPKVNLKAEKEDAKGADTRAKIKALEEPALGPFPASVETLATEPAFRAQTTTSDPNAATAVYVSHVNFPSGGDWRVVAMIKEGDELTVTTMPSSSVGRPVRVPRAGQKAPLIHTPTPSDTGGDLAKITTRIPPDTQNRVDFADVLGKEPVVLLFATPQFCQSRVCGPVVDVAEQVKQLYGDKAAFIHMEIYNDNDPGKDVRPQVKAYHLPSEPWLFVINREGTISTAIEGAFGVDALTAAVKKAIAE